MKSKQISYLITNWTDFANSSVMFYIPEGFTELDKLCDSLKNEGVGSIHRLRQMMDGRRKNTRIFFIHKGKTGPEILVLRRTEDIYDLLASDFSLVTLDILHEENQFICTTYGVINNI